MSPNPMTHGLIRKNLDTDTCLGKMSCEDESRGQVIILQAKEPKDCQQTTRS